MVKADFNGDKGVFERPGYSRVKVIGICSVTVDTVDCWDYEGKAAPTITDRVKARLISQNNDVMFRFQKKNRLLVLQRQVDSGQPIMFTQWKSDTGDYLNSMGSDNVNNATYVEMVRYFNELDESTAAIFAEYRVPAGSGTLSMDPKVVDKVGDLRLTYMQWSKVSVTSEARWMGGGTTYPFKIDYALEGRADESFFGLEVKGKDRKPIAWVSSKGLPVSEAVVQKEAKRRGIAIPQMYDPRAVGFPYQRFQAYASLSGSTVATVWTNVEPTYLGEIKLSVGKTERARIGGIPMK